ncbi:Phosphoglycerate mutase-like protein AT74 [Glycine soja]
MVQVLRADKYFHRVIESDGCSPRVQFYVSPYVHIRSTLHKLRRYFLKKRIIGIREELRVNEIFGTFPVKKRMQLRLLHVTGNHTKNSSKTDHVRASYEKKSIVEEWRHLVSFSTTW